MNQWINEPWFTEGFDTKDLQKAKTLLEELQESARKDEEI